MTSYSIATHGALVFGILAVTAPFALLWVKRKIVPMFASMTFGMASLTCVSAVMGLSAQVEDASMFFDTAPAFMYCSIALLVLVLAVNAWLLWKGLQEK